MNNFGLLALSGVVFLALQACGIPHNYKESSLKDFRLYIESDDDKVQDEFRSLIESFNARACIRALRYAPNKSAANSIVVLTKGLQQRDQKVGWGQWQTTTYQSSPFERAPTSRGKRTTVYTMNLEFDRDYFYQRLKSDFPVRRTELFKLFSHEVGHGLQMDHHEDPGDVMYKDISGEKDFDSYFERVKHFFGDDVERVSC